LELIPPAPVVVNQLSGGSFRKLDRGLDLALKHGDHSIVVSQMLFRYRQGNGHSTQELARLDGLDQRIQAFDRLLTKGFAGLLEDLVALSSIGLEVSINSCLSTVMSPMPEAAPKRGM
jgi:hypothetical protein